MTKTERVLHFIGAAGDEGRRFTDIQRFIVEDVNGLTWRPSHAGYWCDRLVGGVFSEKTAILPKFCKKNEQGCWVLVNPIQRPFTKKKRFW